MRILDDLDDSERLILKLFRVELVSRWETACTEPD